MTRKKYDVKDPIIYEIFKHRLWSICERSHYTLSRVSGSPIVVDAHEYLSGIHKANGDAVLVTTGVTLHLVGMERGVKKIIEWWGEDQIEDGDQFLLNNPYIAAIHTVDMSISKPVFHNGEVIAWISSLFHTPSVPSSLEPGGMCPTATDINQEGLRAEGIKIVQRGETKEDIMRTLRNNSADPDLLGLDHAAKIAANNTGANEVIKMVGEFGVDYVSAAFDRIISETEEMCKRKLKILPDGKWRAVLFQDTTGPELKTLRIEVTMTKKDETLDFDFSGTSPQQIGTVQCAEPGALGHIFAAIASQLFYEVPWNSGVLRAFQYHLPVGSLVNVQFPLPVSYAPLVIAIENAVTQCIAKMYSASDDFKQDINAGWAGGGSPPFFGVNQYNRRFSTITMYAFAGGEGARHDMDGVDSGGLMMTPESEVPNVETVEMLYPLLCLWMREASDTGGPGKFRGGMGVDYAFTPHRAPEKFITGGTIPTGDIYTSIPGISGGYPGSLRRFTLVEGSNILELFEHGEVPSSTDELRGNKQAIYSPQRRYVFKQGDVAHFVVSGGGGYADPLDREPSLVAMDVRNGAISLNAAKSTYGLAFKGDLEIDYTETERARRRMVEERLRRGRKLRDFDKDRGGVGKVIRKHHISEYLIICEHEMGSVAQCAKCGYAFCRSEENYKYFSLVWEGYPSESGLTPERHPRDGGEMIYREFYCPGCGTLLEVEPTMKGAPILIDTELDLNM